MKGVSRWMITGIGNCEKGGVTVLVTICMQKTLTR
jgi:hypothetical protein